MQEAKRYSKPYGPRGVPSAIVQGMCFVCGAAAICPISIDGGHVLSAVLHMVGSSARNAILSRYGKQSARHYRLTNASARCFTTSELHESCELTKMQVNGDSDNL